MKLVIATSNLHKLREYKTILKEVEGLDIYSLRDFMSYSLPPETGSTFEENAKIKAIDAAKHLKALVLADDSGLCVPALDGEPGVISARYAHENASDKENREKLITKLKKLPEHKRVGYFECCIALADERGLQKVAKGRCEGELLIDPRGSQGFGYDPLFLKYNYSKTFAELDPEIKNRISHRRKALDKLLEFFKS